MVCNSKMAVDGNQFAKLVALFRNQQSQGFKASFIYTEKFDKNQMLSPHTLCEKSKGFCREFDNLRKKIGRVSVAIAPFRVSKCANSICESQS
jgi:hypothetical protein